MEPETGIMIQPWNLTDPQLITKQVSKKVNQSRLVYTNVSKTLPVFITFISRLQSPPFECIAGNECSLKIQHAGRFISTKINF